MSNQESVAGTGRTLSGKRTLAETAAKRGRDCLFMLLGSLVIAAPIAFVSLHSSPLPEEALVVALTGWPDGATPSPGERQAR